MATFDDRDRYLTPQEIREREKRRARQLRRFAGMHRGVRSVALLNGGCHPAASPELLLTARPRKG